MKIINFKVIAFITEHIRKERFLKYDMIDNPLTMLPNQHTINQFYVHPLRCCVLYQRNNTNKSSKASTNGKENLITLYIVFKSENN